MRNVGFIISHKKDELRRMIMPEHIRFIHHPDLLFFEKGYGSSISISDEEYEKYGCKIVDRNDIYSCDIIVDRKLGDADYLNRLNKGKILLGAAHAIQGIDFTTQIINNEHTVIATEEIFYKNRYVFYKNNELAGESAILHGFRYCGVMPYETKVAVVGNGHVAKGALRILTALGAQVDVFGRKYEELFKASMFNYDVIVNCVKWDTSRNDHLICKSDLKKFKKGTLIIDISCDPSLGIESSHPTTISNPVYTVDNVIHYAVDNTPSMFPVSATRIISENIWEYINIIMEKEYAEFPDILKKAVVINKGYVLDKRITDFRSHMGL